MNHLFDGKVFVVHKNVCVDYIRKMTNRCCSGEGFAGAYEVGFVVTHNPRTVTISFRGWV